ncbi:hypothetical protein AEAC466_17220 [Asticcacaulis sp. AC466]|uniref:hypothetical protein n=1 Tax=Asticcacaulis sp. AC466 TaxID=1282362 RepID=UPI0003C3B64B|nr:hypothetical protein [Asticcacaulis sp. AC466]ESQ82364.1 hypothetical protein AEAC466_17220 [Asticcacaulis sp. AC466]
MRVKIGSVWHKSEPGRPIMVELSDSDKKYIAGMHADASRFAQFDESDTTTYLEKLTWMEGTPLDEHSDDIAVDRFSAAMKEKLRIARWEKDRTGWKKASLDYLWGALDRHVHKGDPVDVANFAMMIWNVQRDRQGEVLMAGSFNELQSQVYAHALTTGTGLSSVNDRLAARISLASEAQLCAALKEKTPDGIKAALSVGPL